MDRLSIGCALLAGGKSLRMGAEKSGLMLDGRTYVERIAAELSGFEERILSGGGEALARSIGFRHVPDVFPDYGPMCGLYSALTAAESDALFVVACDMPYFSRAVSDYLAENLSANDTGLVCRSPDGRIQSLCGIYTKRCLPHLRHCLEAGNLKMTLMLEELAVRVLQIPPEIADDLCFMNINRPEDII